MPFLSVFSIATISALNRHSAAARAARRWLSTANASCSSRVILYCSARSLRRFAHDEFRKRAEKAVAIHRVDERLIAHLESPAAFEQIGHAAHRLGAAGDDDVRLTEKNLLPAEKHGPQARCARHVDRERRYVVAEARTPRDLPRWIRADASWARVAEDEFIDVPRKIGIGRAAAASPGVRSRGSGEPNARWSAARTATTPKSGAVKSASMPPNFPMGVRTALRM